MITSNFVYEIPTSIDKQFSFNSTLINSLISTPVDCTIAGYGIGCSWTSTNIGSFGWGTSEPSNIYLRGQRPALFKFDIMVRIIMQK